MPHPTAVVAAAVYGSSVAAHLAAEKHRREHPVPTASEWGRMWQVANPRERDIMTRWSQRWTYPRGDDRKAMDQLMYRALREPQMQARITRLERAVGIGATTPRSGPHSVSEPEDRRAPIASGIVVGMDLAWSNGVTGLAALDGTGRLITLGRATIDEQIDAWVASLPGTPSVVAIDAPLVVPNQAGQRPAETMIGRAYGPFGASAHSANRTLLGDQPRASRLAQRFGWTIDPQVRPQPGTTVAIEVYPHAALIGLFGLPYRIAYKKGSTARRRPGFEHVAALLESIAALHLREQPRWREIRAVIDAPAAGDLTRVEDEIDAIVCAHLAWLWQHHPDALHVYGSPTDGYIIAPPLPIHRPVKPAPVVTGDPSGSGGVVRPSPRPVRPIREELRPTRSTASRLKDDALEARGLLIDRILQGAAPVTYADVARHVDRIANGLGPMLDELETLCQKRGEPNLAVLVVNKTTREPTKYARRGDDWRAEQTACLARAWQ